MNAMKWFLLMFCAVASAQVVTPPFNGGGGASPAGAAGIVQLFGTATTFAAANGTNVAKIESAAPAIGGDLFELYSASTVLTGGHQLSQQYDLNLAMNETGAHFADYVTMNLNGSNNYGYDTAYNVIVNVNTTGNVGQNPTLPLSGVNSTVNILAATALAYATGIYGSCVATAGTVSLCVGSWASIETGASAVVAKGIDFYSAVPPVPGGNLLPFFIGRWTDALGGSASQAFAAWDDEAGVWVRHSINTFNAVYQSRPALYNPQFTKFSLAQLNANSYERGVEQWESNVYQIRTEAGSGAGTLRQIGLDGAQVNLGAAAHQVNILGPANFSANVTARTSLGNATAAAAAPAFGTTEDVLAYQVAEIPSQVFVTSTFTTSGVGTALEAITGLTWTFPANTAINMPFHCHLIYHQNGTAVGLTFGFQDATVAPTQLNAQAIVYTSATAFNASNIVASSTTTATAITGTITPSAITTNWDADIFGYIEQPSNGSASVFTIRTSTATAADTVSIIRGSYCAQGIA